MNALAEILTLLALALVVFLAVERWRHRRALRKIKVRIHVNGTRGKSSVTRLLASGLRAGGKKVLAKTTGTLARVILPDERELPVYRPLGANVREQVRIVRLAAEVEAEVLVVECMALQPALQWLSEKAFVRATHGVITNARPDHLDVMGPGPEDVARALCGMMPVNGVCYTAEEEHLAILRAAADDRATRLEAVGRDEVLRLSEDELRRFPWYEHADNIALALSVCTALGVERDVALEGMTKGRPDPGALTFHAMEFFGREIVFVNAFAANDPVSSEQIWQLCLERYPAHEALCLVNCRADRVDRSRQLGETVPGWAEADRIVTAGSGTVFFGRAATRAGADLSRIISLEGMEANDVFEHLVELSKDKTLIVGLGNIGGLGLDLVRLFRNRSRLELSGRSPGPGQAAQGAEA